MKQEKRIEAFVLAGGKSSRMGRDKGMVPLNGKPMISYILETLESLDVPIKIIANDSDYESFGFPVVRDVVKEQGPMGGLLTAFENTKADIVLLVSCDMPLLPKDALNALLEAADEDRMVAAVVGEKVNPLLALYPVCFKKDIEKLISSEHLKMTDFILKNKHTLVPSIGRKKPEFFRNINTQQELKEVEEKWKTFI